MNKIIAGIVGLLFVVAATSGAAYALFTTQVKVNNVAISAGTAGLEFSTDNSTWSTDFTFTDWLAQNITPGFHDHATFYVRNNGSANIDLSLKAQITSYSGNWDAFSGNALVWIGDSAGSVGSGYKPLSTWNSAAQDVNITVAHGTTQTMGIYIDIPSDVGNAIAGQSISTNWTITGTQVSP